MMKETEESKILLKETSVEPAIFFLNEICTISWPAERNSENLKESAKSSVLDIFNIFQHCWNISAIRNALPVPEGGYLPAAVLQLAEKPWVAYVGLKRLKTGFAVPFQASDTAKNYAREARNESRCFKGQKSKISLKKLHSQGMEILKNMLQNEAIKN